MKFYAVMVDDQNDFDCIIEDDTQESLLQEVALYIEKHVDHKILFVFNGTIIDLQNTIENLG